MIQVKFSAVFSDLCVDTEGPLNRSLVAYLSHAIPTTVQDVVQPSLGTAVVVGDTVSQTVSQNVGMFFEVWYVALLH